MALQVSEFTTVAKNNFGLIGMAGAPAVVTSLSSGTLNVAATTKVIRISGSGAITWPGVATPERFEGVEYRAVNGGEALTVSL